MDEFNTIVGKPTPQDPRDMLLDEARASAARFAADAKRLGDLNAEYDSVAEGLLDYRGKQDRKPGETSVDALFRMVSRLKANAAAERLATNDALRRAGEAEAHCVGLQNRLVQLEGLVQRSTERAVEMIRGSMKAPPPGRYRIGGK